MDEHTKLSVLFTELQRQTESIVKCLNELPIDYKLAERCSYIDQEVCNLIDWHEEQKGILKKYEIEKSYTLGSVSRLTAQLDVLNEDVYDFRLRGSSHDQQ